jgi:arylsulfatase A-like enzyme
MKRIPGKYLGLSPALLAVAGLTGFREAPAASTPARTGTHPNILLIMVDQMQTPPEGYGPNEGAVQDLKEIMGFRPLTNGNTYTQYFPGMIRLRQNAVVLKKHYTASAASVPSRSCIMTGQYCPVTGVEHTDGLFKSPADVPFLDSVGAPTIGDWFRAAGYVTHYFGKWHVSDPKPPYYLDQWGFSDWESSYPEPHGGTSSNLGVFRDIGFTENILGFLNEAGTDTSHIPWLTVASLVNPHDISAWPINWQAPGGTGVVGWQNYPPPPPIPIQGAQSRIDTLTWVSSGDTITKIFRVDLNPGGFPNDNSYLSPTFTESLDTKPWCQRDYALKWGLAWGAKTDLPFVQNGINDFRSPHPFQLQGAYDSAWSLSYIRFYHYCEYLADLQIRRILHSLDSNGLTANTIVVFLSDHGDMVTAHGGMIQKWHNAYEESIRVPMVISSPLVNPSSTVMREIVQPTSSIDLAPTLLGLAGLDQAEVRNTLLALHQHSPVNPLVGADLSPYIMGTSSGPIIGPDGNTRTGVLFMGNDRITDLGTVNPGDDKIAAYDLFLSRVDSTIGLGYPLVQGTVRQPSNMTAFCTGDWKLVRYKDTNRIQQDQWELYNLTTDPLELVNIDDFTTGNVRTDVTVPGMTQAQLIQKNDDLKGQLFNATGIAEITPTPGQVTLFQNQPNPFSVQTVIPFFIPEPGTVRLTVTDMSGKEMEILVNQKLPAGFHNCNFDAGPSSSGVYLIKLKFNSQEAVKKMILMK